MPNKIKNNYQQQSLYVGPSPSTGQFFRQFGAETIFTGVNLVSGLYRIQNTNQSFSVNRVPINQFGELAAIDRVILDAPTVGLTFTYLLSNFWNEKNLGLTVDGLRPALSGILNKTQDDKNYFIKIVGEGTDSVGDTSNTVDVAVIGFGNGYVTSYSSKAAVNSFPTVDIGIEAANMVFQTGLSGISPAIYPADGTRISQYSYQIPTALSSPGTGLLDISVLRPGDITMDFRSRTAVDEGSLLSAVNPYDGIGVNINNAQIQGYTLGFNLNRNALQRLGSRFPFSREINFPVDVTLSVDAIVGDLTTGAVFDIVNNDKAFDITINIKKPAAPGDPQPVMARYNLKNCKVNGHSYSQSIGGNLSCTLDFATQIGGGSNPLVGLYMSGVTDVQ